MGKTTITGTHHTTQVLTGSSNVIQVNRGARIEVEIRDDCYGIWEQPGGNHNKAVVNGTVWGINADNGYGIYSQGNDFTVRIGNHGLVKGDTAIMANGADLTVVNKGRIEGGGSAAIQTGYIGADIRNDGMISGTTGISASGNWQVVNSGKIVGSDYAILANPAANDATLIVNHGLLKGGQFSILIVGDGDAEIRNDGRIVGDIDLDAGNDKVDTRGGTIAGKIRGGLGDDTLITNNVKYTLTENAGEGSDTIRSTVSYKLTDNVETLVLLGKKNINATGNNSTDNYLYGNAGNNVLRGLDGYNELFGKGGRDTLIGGADYDLFGLGKGYGRDTVRNFQDGTDQIDIYKLGVDTYAELKPHIKQHGDDTWIAFGKDVLILEDIDKSVLDASDFMFNY